MKNLILALPLLFVAPSCETAKAVLGVPVAVVDDVESGVDAVVPGQEADAGTPPAAEAAGSTVGTIVTLGTGNPAVGAGAGALVTVLVGLFLKRKKKPAVKK